MTDEEELQFAYLDAKRKKSCLRVNPGPELTQDEGAEHFRLLRLRLQHSKAKYGLLFPWLMDLLFRHDPVRLVGCGVPRDEYRFETQMILPKLERLIAENRMTIDDLRAAVYGVFDETFNRTVGDPERRRNTAGRLHDKVYGDIAEEIASFIAAGHFKPSGGGA